MIACLRISSLMTRALAGHASDAERLEIEAHLEECSACRSRHGELEVVGTLRAWRAPALSDTARQRVLATVRTLARETSSPGQRPRYRRTLTVAACVAVLALLVLPAARMVRRPAHNDSVLAPSVQVTAEADGATLRSSAGGRVMLGGASVILAAGTELRWRDAARTATLGKGAVTVEVEPAQHSQFRVATARFIAEVVGTRFVVTLDDVRTERGQVRILDIDGTPRALVGAGEHWSVASPVVPAIAPAPRPATRVPVHLNASATRPSRVEPSPSAQERLIEARRAVAHGEADTARALVQPLIGAARDVAVEARALIAESYLVEGRHGDAIERYRGVVRDFDGTPEAESALYAIAQLEVENGQRADALAALERYLARYPHGRFQREARLRLDRLRGAQP